MSPLPQAATPPPGQPAIDIRELSVQYPGGANGVITALDRATLAVQPGRICALVGANGAGKSTLFSAIMGLVSPTHGAVQLFGEPPAVARRAGTLGYVPQSESVDTTFPVSVSDVAMMGRYGRLGLSAGRVAPIMPRSRSRLNASSSATSPTGNSGDSLGGNESVPFSPARSRRRHGSCYSTNPSPESTSAAKPRSPGNCAPSPRAA